MDKTTINLMIGIVGGMVLAGTYFASSIPSDFWMIGGGLIVVGISFGIIFWGKVVEVN